ncbi:MAG: polysaccharide pyruvyl transferase family protein [Hydrogenophilaceae bacterium]|nr:polysaccharide pyruvyl transferase family protein [Hydrogenophilaceae bacterium]
MPSRIVLFGAFDRHNFGDLLFPHIVSKSLPNQAIEFAGLVDRDMRPWGGHPVKSLVSIPLDENATLIHCGGELLTCTAYEAAVMLQTPEQARQAITCHDADPLDAERWAAEALLTSRRIPYVVRADRGRLIFNAVGGVEWPLLQPIQQEEVIETLRQADWIGVRDHVTQGHLQAAGIACSLCPDPAVMVKEYFDELIQQRSLRGEVAQTIGTFPKGYLACQFAAEFGDDATLDQLANGLNKTCAETGLGVVLFRAGAAPWHDQIEPYERLSARMPAASTRIFHSLNLWDICALLAKSRVYCGSSLHGGIVAAAYGLPHVSLIPPQKTNRPDKVSANRNTWERKSLNVCVKPDEIEQALVSALNQSAEELKISAARLEKIYRENQQQWLWVVSQCSG